MNEEIIIDLLERIASFNSISIETHQTITHCFKSICKIHGLSEKDINQLISNNTVNKLYPKKNILRKSLHT